MLFHITAWHRPENCSAHLPERQAAFRQVMAGAAEQGVQLRSAVIDPPGHTIYLVVESDDVVAITRLLQPVLAYNTYEMRPVAEAGQLMAAMAAQS